MSLKQHAKGKKLLGLKPRLMRRQKSCAYIDSYMHIHLAWIPIKETLWGLWKWSCFRPQDDTMEVLKANRQYVSGDACCRQLRQTQSTTWDWSLSSQPSSCSAWKPSKTYKQALAVTLFSPTVRAATASRYHNNLKRFCCFFFLSKSLGLGEGEGEGSALRLQHAFI